MEKVSAFLQGRRHRYALIGGVALAAYGLARTTVDLDLVIDRSAQDELIAFLEASGYATLHRSTGYSNHLHSDAAWGRLDCVYVGGATSEELFAACRLVEAPGGLEVPLPKPEHLAALKVVAMKNDPGRTFQELADIRFLVQLPQVDRSEVRGYFDRHGLQERFDELEKSL
ncbi:MAG: nucleotidyl transferase AbiEii/AbiGii toxin family protein [Acidobacteriota bacterium]|nr:nucleotidyl transferase AbiEii/AbiGii toxin family protein [Acidobacteriota bacterium]